LEEYAQILKTRLNQSVLGEDFFVGTVMLRYSLKIGRENAGISVMDNDSKITEQCRRKR